MLSQPDSWDTIISYVAAVKKMQENCRSRLLINQAECVKHELPITINSILEKIELPSFHQYKEVKVKFDKTKSMAKKSEFA